MFSDISLRRWREFELKQVGKDLVLDKWIGGSSMPGFWNDDEVVLVVKGVVMIGY